MLVLRDTSSSNSAALWAKEGGRGLYAREGAEPAGPGGTCGTCRDLVLRVVLVHVDVVQRGLLQAEDVDHGPVQDVVGLSEELIEAPALLLVRLQDVGQNRGQVALKTPERTREHSVRWCSRGHSDSGGRKVSYLDRLQDTGMSELHSIFPFSHF